MNPADQAEDESVRRFARFEWLSRQIQQAEREADAHLRLEHALHRTGDRPPGRTPPRHVSVA